MRQPNGYGSVYKLSGNRRNPWCVRITIGWEMNMETGKVIQKRRIIGTYPTQKKALIALADYNKDPHNLDLKGVTFEDIYEKWSEKHYASGISKSNVKGYQASYRLCTKLYNMKLNDITIDHLQQVVDESGKNTPTLKKLKNLFSLMWEYAVVHDIVTQDKKDKIKYLDINKAGNPNAYNRKPFSKTEVQTVWKWKDSSIYIKVVLMLIYSGVRISELLDLKKVNVNLEERWFDVVQSKTEAGVRKVPINDKVLPFFQEWYDMNDCEYLISTPEGKHFEYRNYYDSYWTPFMNQMNMQHTPHEARHTCISLLTAQGVDERIIKKIVGHKGQGVTQTVYTHIEIDDLLKAINMI